MKQNLHPIITVTLGNSDYIWYHGQFWPMVDKNNFLELHETRKLYPRNKKIKKYKHRDFTYNPFQCWFI